jgi:hypothetical protein
MGWDTVVGVDWSGAKDPVSQRNGTWAAIAVGGCVVRVEPGTREEVMGLIDSLDGSVLVGLDFAPTFPRWFVTDHLGCPDVYSLWERVAADGERWLAGCPPPFWGRTGTKKTAGGLAVHRACELAVGAKSVFQIAGAGSVGTGSIRGMPWLSWLRERHWAVWPFDAPGPRTVVEAYPRVAKGRASFTDPVVRREFLAPVPQHHLGPVPRGAAIASEDAFDAVVTALALWQQGAALERVDREQIDAIEGDFWPKEPLDVANLRGA